MKLPLLRPSSPLPGRTRDLASARTTVDEALGLWRGQVLDGVPGPAAAAARPRFQRLRLALAATRAELDLELGAFESAAADLEDLLRTHPDREDLRLLYLLALRRQGRTEEALEAYEVYRDRGGQNPELLALGHELREALRDERPELQMEEPVYEEDPPLLGGDDSPSTSPPSRTCVSRSPSGRRG
ncbi:BTAD domain-containing putative transcriptional regulator [Streptomyces cellulosae]